MRDSNTALFDLAVVERRYVGPPFVVTSDAIRAYAEATNDSTPGALAGSVAPPVFTVVPLRPVLRQMLQDVTPLYEQLKGLHGEHDMFFFSPVVAGMTLTPHGSVIGILPRPTGTAVVLNIQTRDDDYVLVNEHFATLYFPGAKSSREAVGADPPPHRLPQDVGDREPCARISQQTDADQPMRYSLASGDTGAYHLDEQAAHNAGLPGIIMHGMCTLAIVACGILGEVANGDVTQLHRLAARFSRPVIPGEALHTNVWLLGDERRRFGFETRNAEGVPVVSHGRVEIV
jgi:acyl dehydratase